MFGGLMNFMPSSPTIGGLSMKLNYEFKIIWLVWFFKLFIYSVKWSFLNKFLVKICVWTPILGDSCVCNLFIEYDFDFFEKYMGYGYMSIFYSMVVKGTWKR